MEIIMPSLGETVDEGKVVKWLKKVGDEIKEGDILCEVETDKTAAEIPSTVNGKLTEIIAQEGDTIPVGGKIATVE
ncbi:biotin attachment protein [Alphaproteobacteria bacterium]|jgi:2-oxoisovalerate dehydrogenase E2 component (dihydrolipoyl transacylase)|nr:biotin attachment protein [Alphaproteobacteria bacterium]|tara:strand:- start:2720 stop:2947 length:228 start_codon:yes stop_codon:yes gene_type:complete